MAIHIFQPLRIHRQVSDLDQRSAGIGCIAQVVADQRLAVTADDVHRHAETDAGLPTDTDGTGRNVGFLTTVGSNGQFVGCQRAAAQPCLGVAQLFGNHYRAGGAQTTPTRGHARRHCLGNLRAVGIDTDCITIDGTGVDRRLGRLLLAVCGESADTRILAGYGNTRRYGQPGFMGVGPHQHIGTALIADARIDRAVGDLGGGFIG